MMGEGIFLVTTLRETHQIAMLRLKLHRSTVTTPLLYCQFTSEHNNFDYFLISAKFPYPRSKEQNTHGTHRILFKFVHIYKNRFDGIPSKPIQPRHNGLLVRGIVRIVMCTLSSLAASSHAQV